MSTSVPHASDAEPPTALTRWLVARRLTATLLIFSGLAVVIGAKAVRSGEASVAAMLVGVVTRTDTAAWGEHGSFYWGLGSGDAHGLRITAECSSAYVAGPVLVVFGLLLLSRRLPLVRVLTGAAAGLAVVILVNMARIVLIADTVNRWSSDAAFWWSHIVVGSTLAVVGNIAALALALRTAFRGAADRRLTAPQPPTPNPAHIPTRTPVGRPLAATAHGPRDIDLMVAS